MNLETLNQFIARGGQVFKAEPGRVKYDHSVKYRKDKQLQALKLLAKQTLSPKDLLKIELAIMTRTQILKVTP